MGLCSVCTGIVRRNVCLCVLIIIYYVTVSHDDSRLSYRNLQTAIGCYMDYLATARAPQMKVLKSCTVGEGEGVTPNTS